MQNAGTRRSTKKLIVRKAKFSDADEIHKLINRYASEDKMLPRSIAEIHEHMNSFFVAEHDGKIVGCCSLQAYYHALGEVRSLAVLDEYTGKGIGTKLVRACLSKARKLGMKEVFTFTYVPKFFKRFHFKRVKREKIHPKLWIECMKCPKYPNCDEKAMILKLE